MVSAGLTVNPPNRGRVPTTVCREQDEGASIRLARAMPPLGDLELAGLAELVGQLVRQPLGDRARSGFLEPGWFRGGIREWQINEGLVIPSSEP